MSFGTKLGISNNSFLQDRAVLLSATDGYQGPVVQDDVYDNFVADQSSINILDIGAGFSMSAENPENNFDKIAPKIKNLLKKEFGNHKKLRIIAEPGRLIC